jgi:hypothetical protein
MCVSSQVGCANMGCSFCATGTKGIVGDLSAGEIVEQLLHIAVGSSVRTDTEWRQGRQGRRRRRSRQTRLSRPAAGASMCGAHRIHRRRVHRGRHRSRHHASLTAVLPLPPSPTHRGGSGLGAAWRRRRRQRERGVRNVVLMGIGY